MNQKVAIVFAVVMTAISQFVYAQDPVPKCNLDFQEMEISRTAFENSNPYAIFGINPVMLDEYEAQLPKHLLVVENSDPQSYIARMEQDMQTGFVKIYDRNGCVILEKHLTGTQKAWPTIDPLAEKRYSVSPYVFVSNNPVNKFDPDGKDEFYFDVLGQLVDRVSNDQPDTFFQREIHTITKIKEVEIGGGVSIMVGTYDEITTTDTPIDLNSDIGYMIRTVYAEAAGQNSATKLAVAEVIRNRADDTSPNSAATGWNAVFGKVNTYTDVVTQPGKFESVGNNVPRYSDPASVIMPNGRRNEIETNAFVQSIGVSINATRNNTNIAQGATYFFDTSISTPSWANKMHQVTIPNGSNRMKFYRY